MSVVRNEREDGKLMVIVKSLDLCEYTIHICKNEKNFPKRARWILTNDIVNEAKEQFKCIRSANSISVTTNDEYRERHMLQIRAYEHLETLLSYLEIAFKEFDIPKDRIEFWVGKCLETETLLQRWKSSDTERYQK